MATLDHRLGQIAALRVVEDQASPADHPAEGALHDPSARDHLEAERLGGAAEELDDDVEKGGFVHELGAVGPGVSEQVIQPWPALADGHDDQIAQLAKTRPRRRRAMGTSGVTDRTEHRFTQRKEPTATLLSHLNDSSIFPSLDRNEWLWLLCCGRGEA